MINRLGVALGWAWSGVEGGGSKRFKLNIVCSTLYEIGSDCCFEK